MSTLRSQLRVARDRLFPRTGNALGCGKKTRYINEHEAGGALRTRQPHETATLYKYPCTECGGWHLTKLKPPERAQT
jgi:hypothetical protein